MKLVGMDVFVVSSGLPKVPEKIAGFELKAISNRGTKVWPGATPSIQLTDSFGCRYLSPNPQPLALLEALEKAGFTWVHVEKLHDFGDKPGYSAL